MAMLISKFHRLIQSRLLWGIFLMIIVFTFVIWGTQMPGDIKEQQEANAAGKLDGQVVTQDEYRNAYFNVLMSFSLMMGRPITVTDQIDKELRAAAWRRVAALRQAKALGLTAADKDVVAAIQQNPGFAPEGRFSQAHYNAFVQNVLAQLGFNELQFEEHVREEIILQTLRRMIQQMALVSPLEVQRTFRSLSDTFKLAYVTLTASNVADTVKLTAEDAKTYFLANPAAFKIPEKVVVKYVEFPFSNYLAQAEVTEEAALDFYNENLDDYALTNRANAATNALAAGTNLDATAQAPKSNYIPFDDVKTNIFDALRLRAARDQAAEKATDFVVMLTPDRSGNAPSFDEAAGKFGAAVKQLPAFSLREELPGISAGYEFNRAAFRLNQQPEEYFSDAVVGSNAVYVLALVEKQPARAPEYEEVKEQVLQKARANALNEALVKKAQDLREAVTKALEEGRTFDSAVKPFGVKPVWMKEFSVAGGEMETNQYTELILRGVMTRNAGEVSDLLTAEDAVILAYVADRKPSDSTQFDELRPQLIDSARRRRGQVLFEDWQNSLLKQGQLEDKNEARRKAAEEAAAEGADVDENEDASDTDEARSRAKFYQ